MTEVCYEDFRMEVRGHAGSGPQGQDLVCAGVSTLCAALLNAAVRYGADMYVDEDEALIRVECRPEERDEEACREMFRVVLMGFAYLENIWPEYVSIDYCEEEL